MSTQFKFTHITRRVAVLHNFPQPAEPVSHRMGDIQQKDSLHLAFLEMAAVVSSPKRRTQLCAIGFSSQTLQQVPFHYSHCNTTVPKEWCSHKLVIPFHCGTVLFVSHKERNISPKNANRSYTIVTFPEEKNMINSLNCEMERTFYECVTIRKLSLLISITYNGGKKEESKILSPSF